MCTRKKQPDREPQVAAGEESGDGEGSDAQSHVEGDHQRDRRALRRGVGNAAGDVDDIGRAADPEQCAEHAAEETRRHGPRPPERPPRATMEHDVQRIAADEHPECEERGIAREADEERHAEGEADDRERRQHQQLTDIGLLLRVNAECRRRSEIEGGGERQDERQRQHMREHGDRDR